MRGDKRRQQTAATVIYAAATGAAAVVVREAAVATRLRREPGDGGCKEAGLRLVMEVAKEAGCNQVGACQCFRHILLHPHGISILSNMPCIWHRLRPRQL